MTKIPALSVKKIEVVRKMEYMAKLGVLDVKVNVGFKIGLIFERVGVYVGPGQVLQWLINVSSVPSSLQAMEDKEPSL